MTLGTALGCGLIAGTFFAFSTFVMKALARLPPAEGIRAMQSINVAVINPRFLGAFVGTAAACALLAVLSPMTWTGPGAALRLVGCVLYLAGCFGVTMAFNVPRNDALAKLQPDAVEAAAGWARYVAGWTAWNHVRTAAALAAAALLGAGARGAP
ncbi:MAG TPA: anthrone oxygenase family protein [Haliangiales bacterium]|nr:anthrone oxygenase family protein [Haliangiales bacterium]